MKRAIVLLVIVFAPAVAAGWLLAADGSLQHVKTDVERRQLKGAVRSVHIEKILLPLGPGVDPTWPGHGGDNDFRDQVLFVYPHTQRDELYSPDGWLLEATDYSQKPGLPRA